MDPTRDSTPNNGEGEELRGEEWAHQPDDEHAERRLALWVEASRTGAKPVTKIEPVHEDQLAEWLNRTDIPNVRHRKRTDQNAWKVYEVFFGADAELVERTVALSEIEEANCTREEVAEAMTQVGVLLGYPECCSRTFAWDETWVSRSEWSWLHLARRVAGPESVAPEFNPFVGAHVPHVPCSLECEASVEYVRRFDSAVEKVLGDGTIAESLVRARHPWLMLVRGQSHGIELVPEGEPGARFRYKVGVVSGEAPEWNFVREADEIVIEAERLWLYRGGEPHYDLSASAYLWWHEAKFQTAFWEQILAIRELTSPANSQVLAAQDARRAMARAEGVGELPGVDSNRPDSGGQASGTPAQPVETRFGVAARGLLLSVGGTVAADTLRIDGIVLHPTDQVSFRVIAGDTSLDLRTEPNEPGRPAWFKVGPLAFSHPGSGNPDEAQQKLAVRFRRAVIARLRKDFEKKDGGSGSAAQSAEGGRDG